MHSPEDGIESTERNSESGGNTLRFLDSVDNYLILMESLSSALRQGWLELASARHSMGVSRVNSTLFDLKSHHASTTLQVQDCDDIPLFKLFKWASSDDPGRGSKEAELEEGEQLHTKSESPQLLHRRPSQSSELQEKRLENCGSAIRADDQAQKERFKSLSIFGTLVSPKLRATQISFETALKILVEMSNARASLLCAFEQLQTIKNNTSNEVSQEKLH